MMLSSKISPAKAKAIPKRRTVWHAVGYDKLKPYGFPVHGCIDSWNRKVLRLPFARSNIYPDNIVSDSLETVEKYGGRPMKVYTDLRTQKQLDGSSVVLLS